MIDGHTLKRVNYVNFLGVYLDEKLKWQIHIMETSKKLSRNIGIIIKVKDSFSTDILQLLYYALVYPHLIYCLTLWGCAKPSKLQVITKLQKRVVRIMTHSGPRELSDPLFSKLGILKIADLYQFQTCLYVFKSRYLPSSVVLGNVSNSAKNVSQFNPTFHTINKIHNTRTSSHKL